MITIRKSVFETNSSSVHALAVSGKDYLAPPQNVSGGFGEYGWGYERLHTIDGRLSYLLTDIMRKYDLYGEKDNEKVRDTFLSDQKYIWTNEMVKDFTGKNIQWDWSELGIDYPFGYIDHQSIGGQESINDHAQVLGNFWSENEQEFKDNMKDFVFNQKYTVIIDNDNH